MKKKEMLNELRGLLSKAHPWHGIYLGENSPEVVTSYIEIVPGDTVKYELDKFSGYLKIDRPQEYSSVCPALYGMVPQTYCDTRVANYCMEKTGLKGIKGDKDPLDICVLTEKIIPHGDIILEAIPIGGFRMIDRDEADDKIIAVLKNDAAYGKFKEVSDCPTEIIERLKHYFLTYKDIPGTKKKSNCSIAGIYSREEAWDVINFAAQDYRAYFSI